jgi:8-oxo-dGTP pyrophosphatase MutT (NUDIX family)
MKFIATLKNHLENNHLPGRIAQYDMAHGERKTWLENYETPANAKVAATLTLLYPKQDLWYVALMQRVSHEKDRHSGQVSFPGGKVEKSDINLQHTALREAEEELGILSSEVTILGQMTELYIPVSNFLVYPFIGFAAKMPTFNLQPSEVQRVIEAPLSVLLNKQNRKFKDINLPNDVQLKGVPYFDVNGNVVWGATAMMLSEFTAIMDSISNV